MKKTIAFFVFVILMFTASACLSPKPTSGPAPTTLPETTDTPTVTLIVPTVTVTTAAIVTETASSSPSVSAINVDGAITYQVIDGFGASGAFKSASHMHGSTGLSPEQQQAILDLLFSTETGAGLSIWRNEIGSSSTAGVGGPDDGDNVPSIEPNDPGGPDAAPVYTWDGSDGDQLWLSLQAKSYGVTQFYATAWGAPAYMKTNNSLKDGGYLCGVPGQECPSGDWRQHFADYLVQYLQYYRAAGIEITYIGFQNEPDLSPSYTGMNWDTTHVSGDRGQVDPATPQNIDFISNYLGPTLEKSGLSTRIACCDATDWNRAITYANGVLADPTANAYIGLITGHGYYMVSPGMLGPVPVTSAIEAGKPVWQSEAAIFNTWNPTWDGGDSGSSGIHWAEALWDALVNTQVNAYFYWWGAKAYEAGGNTANSPLIKIVEDTYEPSKRLWAFANYSRFIRPGATRIEANTDSGDLKVSAFVNADGRYVIVVLNKARTDQAMTFSLQNIVSGGPVLPYLTNEANNAAEQPGITIINGAFTANIPARSLVTYVLPAGWE